jgi:superfamily II DNA or RNA helicase
MNTIGMICISKNGMLKKDLDKIKTDLTFIDHTDEQYPEYKIYLEIGNNLYVPRGYDNFKYYNVDSVDIPNTMQEKTEFKISLREYQNKAVDTLYENMIAKGGATLIGGCGTGKTIMGIATAMRLKHKTCILVHKEFLIEQWVERIEMSCSNCKIGIWQQSKEPDEDCDFVIAMVQSLYAREYSLDIYNRFDLVITDEVHRFSAPTWQNIISNFKARYRIGLTATPNRRDGLQEIFYNHIGRSVYEIQGTLLNPTIFKYETKIGIAINKYTDFKGGLNNAKLLTILSENKDRNNQIATLLTNAKKRNRKILLLSDRIVMLDNLLDILTGGIGETEEIRKYVGGLSTQEREQASKARIILATYGMAQEGLDIPDIDTLFLATPKADVVQAVGRILRPHPDKLEPVVMDFVDHTPLTYSLYKKRKQMYESNNYLIRDYK